MRYLLSAALILVPNVCSAEIYQTKDAFSGEVTYNTKLRGAHLEGGSFISMRYVNFELFVNKSTQNTESPICILIMTQTEGWSFIKSGPSLILKLSENDFLTLSGLGSANSRKTLGGDTVSEAAAWCTSIEIAEKVGASKSVQFRVLGDERTLTGSFDAKFLNDFAEMTRFVRSNLTAK